MGIYYCWKMQVSDLINCGVYVFTPDIFTAIQDISAHREDRGWFLQMQPQIIAFHVLFYF